MTQSDPQPDVPEINPRRLHPATPLVDLVALGRQFFFVAVIAMFASGRPLVFAAIALIGAATILAGRFIVWSRFTYQVTDGLLRVDKGVASRERREVPLTRIQQVNLQRKLIHRVLGLAVVRVDTAGSGAGGDAEIVLDAIGDAEASRLRGLLLVYRSESAGLAPSAAHTGASNQTGSLVVPMPPPPPAPPEVVVHLDARKLALAGVTGRHLAAVLALAVGAVYGYASYLPEATLYDTASRTWSWMIGSFVLFVGVTVAALFVWLVAAAVASVVQDHDYTLVRRGSDLHVRRGLLQQRESTVALDRIQAVRILDNPIRRRLGLVTVQLQSGGGGTAANAGMSRLTIPILHSSEFERFVALVAPGAPCRPTLTPAPLAARRRWRTRAVAPVIVAVIALALIAANLWVLIALLLVAPAFWWADSYYAALGHAVSPTHVVTRWGAVFGRRALMPIAKVQGTQLTSTVFQRRAALATLRFAVAGDAQGIPVRDAGAATLGHLRRGILASGEPRLDEQATRRRTASTRTDMDRADQN